MIKVFNIETNEEIIFRNSTSIRDALTCANCSEKNLEIICKTEGKEKASEKIVLNVIKNGAVCEQWVAAEPYCKNNLKHG